MDANEYFPNPELLSLPLIQESIVANSLEHYSSKGCRYLTNMRCDSTKTSILSYANFCIKDCGSERPAQQFGLAELILCFNQFAYATFVAARLEVNIPASHRWTIRTSCNIQFPMISTVSTLLHFNSPLNTDGVSAYLICKDFKVHERYSRIMASCSIKFQDNHGGSAIGEFKSSVFAQKLTTGSDRAAQHPAMP